MVLCVWNLLQNCTLKMYLGNFLHVQLSENILVAWRKTSNTSDLVKIVLPSAGDELALRSLILIPSLPARWFHSKQFAALLCWLAGTITGMPLGPAGQQGLWCNIGGWRKVGLTSGWRPGTNMNNSRNQQGITIRKYRSRAKSCSSYSVLASPNSWEVLRACSSDGFQLRRVIDLNGSCKCSASLRKTRVLPE